MLEGPVQERKEKAFAAGCGAAPAAAVSGDGSIYRLSNFAALRGERRPLFKQTGYLSIV
jgi:hypothetical protein